MKLLQKQIRKKRTVNDRRRTHNSPRAAHSSVLHNTTILPKPTAPLIRVFGEIRVFGKRLARRIRSLIPIFQRSLIFLPCQTQRQAHTDPSTPVVRLIIPVLFLLVRKRTQDMAYFDTSLLLDLPLQLVVWVHVEHPQRHVCDWWLCDEKSSYRVVFGDISEVEKHIAGVGLVSSFCGRSRVNACEAQRVELRFHDIAWLGVPLVWVDNLLRQDLGKALAFKPLPLIDFEALTPPVSELFLRSQQHAVLEEDAAGDGCLPLLAHSLH